MTRAPWPDVQVLWGVDWWECEVPGQIASPAHLAVQGAAQNEDGTRLLSYARPAIASWRQPGRLLCKQHGSHSGNDLIDLEISRSLTKI